MVQNKTHGHGRNFAKISQVVDIKNTSQSDSCHTIKEEALSHEAAGKGLSNKAPLIYLATPFDTEGLYLTLFPGIISGQDQGTN